jgi:gamma-glutamyl phosphate reductase
LFVFISNNNLAKNQRKQQPLDQSAGRQPGVSQASGEKKNAVLQAMAEGLLQSREQIFAVNAEDVAAARAGGLSAAFVDRLTLNLSRLEAMARGLRQIAELGIYPAVDPLDSASRIMDPRFYRDRSLSGRTGCAENFTAL